MRRAASLSPSPRELHSASICGGRGGGQGAITRRAARRRGCAPPASCASPPHHLPHAPIGSAHNWQPGDAFRAPCSACFGRLRSTQPPAHLTSSMKMMDGDFSRASENRLLTSFSDSPSHLSGGGGAGSGGCAQGRSDGNARPGAGAGLHNGAARVTASGAGERPQPARLQAQSRGQTISLGDQV